MFMSPEKMTPLMGAIMFEGHPETSLTTQAFHVDFIPAFSQIPSVFVALSGLDSDHCKNTRVMLNVQNVTSNGCDIVANSWCDTIIWGGRISWIATENPCNNIGDATLNNLAGDTDHRSRDMPISKTVDVVFDKIYSREGPCPEVVAMISGLDTDCNKNMRISVSTDNITHTGFRINARTWLDSYVYAIKVSWFATTSSDVRCTTYKSNENDMKIFCGGHGEEKRKSYWDKPYSTLRPSNGMDNTSVGCITGFTEIDTDSGRNTRIFCNEDVNPTETSCRFSVGTWSDSSIYNVGVSAISAICGAPLKKMRVRLQDIEFPSDYDVLLPFIAEGYFGRTYRAKHKIDKNDYCLKLFKHDITNHQVTIQRELNNLISLPYHVNIVRYHCCTIVNGKLFIITEYINGCQFHKLKNPECDILRRPEGLLKIVSMATQLFEGLSHLHISPIVHRDLHPGNILIKYMPGSSKDIDFLSPGSIKIIDVGNAVTLGDHNMRDMTPMGGAYSYYSPERARQGPFNEKDDVWAAAIILLEILIAESFSPHDTTAMKFAEKSISKFPSLGKILRRVLSEHDEAERRPSSKDIYGQLNHLRSTLV
eukprot:gene1016-1992_t